MICNRRNFIKRFLTLGAAAVTTAAAKTKAFGATKLTTLKVAGLQYGECTDDTFILDESLSLVPEPDNPYDRYAVAIFKKEKRVGYIPKTNSRIVASIIENGSKVHARVRYFDKHKDPWDRVWVSVWMEG